MTGPGELMSVSCYTCLNTVWRGDQLPSGKDGQDLLNDFAGPDGRLCPGLDPECPHKPAARAQQRRQRVATMADLEDVKNRLDKLEASVIGNPTLATRVTQD